jgi:glycosyltransferase involved in cell wall biosynthesis
MSPTVSVVIPAYNHAAFVGDAIKSVLNQSHTDVEICVTDDGSVDQTPDVIRQFTDARVRLEVFPENRGAVIALNSAIRRARGEFICYLSSDDFFLPGKLEMQLRFLRANPRIWATFGLPHFIDERGKPLPKEANHNANVFEAPLREGLASPAAWLRWFFFNCNCLCHPTIMIRRAVFEEIGLFDPRLANLPDFDMWVRLCAGHDIHVANDELIAMRILDGNRNMSAPRSDSLIRTLTEYYLVLKHFRFFSRDLLEQVFSQEIAAHPEWSSLTTARLLGEVSLLAAHPCHRFFAVDTILDEVSSESTDYRRLYEVTGSLDLFGQQAAETFQTEVAKLRTALAESESRSHAIRNEALRLAENLRRELAEEHIARNRQQEALMAIARSVQAIRTSGDSHLRNKEIERMELALRSGLAQRGGASQGS